MSYFIAPQELRDLAYRYALAVDGREARALASIFTEDGTIRNFDDHPLQYSGATGFSRMMRDLGMFARTMHCVFNQTFERSAEGTVTGLTYCIASHLLQGTDPVKVDMGLIYHDLYRHAREEWRFAERRIEVLWIARQPVRYLSASISSLEDAFRASGAPAP